jgi:hypothetical protein
LTEILVNSLVKIIMPITQSLKDYQKWCNKNVYKMTNFPKCRCGGVMLWSINICENCASFIEINNEIKIIEGYLKIDVNYWSNVLNKLQH